MAPIIDTLPANNQLDTGRLYERPHLRRILLAIIFLVAFLFRIYQLHAPGILIEREYRSAIQARYYYYQREPGIADWQIETVISQLDDQPTLEPPITEYLVSWLYTIRGEEQLWYAHLLTSTFWLLSGGFFYLFARCLVTSMEALLALGFYLLAPLAVLTSRSFQPDALMAMFLMTGLFTGVLALEKPTLSRVLLACILIGATILVRPQVIFVLTGAIIAGLVSRYGFREGLLSLKAILVTVIFILPATLYYGFIYVTERSTNWNYTSSFQPHLYLHVEFWRGWAELALNAVGLGSLAIGLLGFALLKRGLPQALVAGFGIGYLLFGLVFTYHIHTHGY